ncbi:MAG: TIGR01212 family radical SAM protein [Desulfamplus sp.]|nr:TIGR01212 family radical SAM protein [Desulfamplus sp.]MBF0412803.1 TIGR01212 family radical SAM protein [Desulfamplus sp.]
MEDKKRRYSDYNSYLKSLYGERVQKIIVDAGLNCPNRDGTISRGGCIYCNGKGSGSGLWSKGVSITEQIELGRNAMTRRYSAKKFLIYFQSYTNTYTSCERMKEMYDEALRADGVVGMAIGTRPDCIDQDKIDLIDSYADKYLVWLEYGLQSSHDRTLELINRGHDFACFVKSVQMAKEKRQISDSHGYANSGDHKSNGINVCAHVILGLPGETREMMIETAQRIGELGIHGVKIHLLYVVKGTFLEKMFKNGSYACMTQNDYVETVCDFIEHLPANIVIQRITGDPHPDELAAPEWALDKHKTFNMIQKTFEKRDSWQGKLYVKKF